MTWSDSSSPERRDDALVRFEELDAPDTDIPACVRVTQRWAQWFERRNLDAIGTLYAEEAVFEDRRPMLAATFRGPDAHIAALEVMVDTGTTRVEFTPLATRGERLALFRMRAWGPEAGAGAFNDEVLVVHELTDDGHLCGTVLFGPDDLHAATQELDRRRDD